MGVTDFISLGVNWVSVSTEQTSAGAHRFTFENSGITERLPQTPLRFVEHVADDHGETLACDGYRVPK
jgi:hypothetical protein